MKQRPNQQPLDIGWLVLVQEVGTSPLLLQHFGFDDFVADYLVLETLERSNALTGPI